MTDTPAQILDAVSLLRRATADRPTAIDGFAELQTAANDAYHADQRPFVSTLTAVEGEHLVGVLEDGAREHRERASRMDDLASTIRQRFVEASQSGQPQSAKLSSVGGTA